MPKITITIEDKLDGNVEIISRPNFAEMMEKMEEENRTGGLTPAEGYALFALNTIHKESKKEGPINLRLPRLFGKG